MAVQRCHSITTRGKRCKRLIKPDRRYCWQHQDRPIRTRPWFIGLFISAIGIAMMLALLPLILTDILTGEKDMLTPILFMLGAIPFVIGQAMMRASKFDIAQEDTAITNRELSHDDDKYAPDNDKISPHKQYLLDELDDEMLILSEKSKSSTISN